MTLHATDLAGNTSVTTFSYTLNSDSTPPVITVGWPQDTMNLCGDTFNVDGWLDDPAMHEYQVGLYHNGGQWCFRTLLVPANGWSYFNGGTVVQPQTWYHLALTYDGAALQQYVNGAGDGSVAASGPIQTTTRPLVIGGWSANWWNLNGEVDEPSLYNRALSQSEIQSIYNAGPAGKTLGGGPPPSSGCWTAWVDDAVPAGAPTYANNESWTWITGNPSPFHGTACHPSANVAGFHQHYFYNAPQTLPVNAGDTLFCYVYLDPANPPGEVMLQWQAADYTGWSHRAYWGADAGPVTRHWSHRARAAPLSPASAPPTGGRG